MIPMQSVKYTQHPVLISILVFVIIRSIALVTFIYLTLIFKAERKTHKSFTLLLNFLLPLFANIYRGFSLLL